MRQPRNEHIGPDGHADPPRGSLDRYGQINNQVRHRKTRLPLYFGGGVIAILILIVAVAALSKQFRHQLALSLVRQPTPYTQLYFPHLGALPDKLKVNQKNTFEFTIVNNEGRTFRYTYIVASDDSKSHLRSTGVVTINNGHSVTRSVAVIPKDHKSRYQIGVTLKGINQSIHFYGTTS